MGSAQDRQRRSQAIALRRSIMRCLYGVMAAANLIKSQGPLLHIQNGNAGTQSGQQLVSSTDSGNANVPTRSKTKTFFLWHMSDIRYQTYQISYQSHQGASKKIKVCLVSSRDLSAGNTEVKPHTPRFLKKQTCSWRGHISCVPFPAPPRSFQHRTVKTDHPTLTLHVLLHQQL